MKRILAIALLVVACVGVGAHKVQQSHWMTELRLDGKQEQWLKKRLDLQTRIQTLEKRLELLQARYQAIPDGAPYHTPWASLADIKAFLRAVEADPQFKKSQKCQVSSDESRQLCKDYHRAKQDEFRWYSLTKISVEISNVMHELMLANIEAWNLDDAVKQEARKELTKYVRET